MLSVLGPKRLVRQVEILFYRQKINYYVFEQSRSTFLPIELHNLITVFYVVFVCIQLCTWTQKTDLPMFVLLRVGSKTSFYYRMQGKKGKLLW